MRRLIPWLLLGALVGAGGCDWLDDDPSLDGGGGGGGGGGGSGGPEGKVSGQLTLFQGAQMTSRGVSPRFAKALFALREGSTSSSLAGLPARFGEVAARQRLLGSSSPAPAWPKERELVAGEVIVAFREKLEPEAALARVKVKGLWARHLGRATEHLHLVRYVDAEGVVLDVGRTKELVRTLGARKGVRFAEQNALNYPAAVPNDRYYNVQWHYPAMNLPAAWDLTQGSSAVVVAIIDTGIVAHPDLGTRVLPGADLISEASRAQDGDGRDLDPTDMGQDLPNGDSSWHGTHVAGTIGAASNDGQGVAGVDWAARLLPVRVLGKGGGTLFDIAAGMAWAVGQNVPGMPANANPAKVVNMSLGGGGSDPSPSYQDIINASASSGVVWVIAAGNSNESAARWQPCNQQNVLCVGSTRHSGARASYSNFGTPVDVMGPGGEVSEDQNGDGYPDGVLSTYRNAQNQPSFEFQQGTSMATPHVAGLLALMKAVNAQLGQRQAESILKATANPASRCQEGCGAGLVNAHAAVLSAKGQVPSGPAKLAISASELFISNPSAKGVIGLSNLGGQPLTVNATAAGAQGGALSFPGGASVTVGPGQASALEVAANLTALSPGTHAAQVELTSNGGSASVSVKLRAGGSAGERDAVLALVYQDALGEWKAGGGGAVPASAGYAYGFFAAAGRYYVVAAVDDNGNGTFFEDGERAGFFPTMDNPLEVQVVENQEVGNVDFSLVPLKAVSEGGLRVGGSCTSDPDCPGGGCVTAWPGGYCTKDCASASCPVGGKCYAVAAGADRCLSTCAGPGTGKSDCRASYVCYPDATGAGYCLPACTSSQDCDPGSTCNLATGYCE